MGDGHDANLVTTQHRRQSWGLGVATPQILGRGVVGVPGGSQGDRGRVVKYYYILSYTGSVFESGDF